MTEESKYRCIVADPPWNERGGGKIKRGADRHYPLMKTPDIIACMLRAPVWRPAESAHLWLWVTDNFLLDGLQVMGALGFRYVRTMAWFKQQQHQQLQLKVGLGYYLRGAHELCLFGVRGTASMPAKAPASAVLAPRTEHSKKPDAAFALIEQASPAPRLEMFARRPRPGWDVWGNEVGEAST